ncbi:winged helix-turn-helix domain-containing protein [Streptomyces sp. RFCAC02]|uniref:winged helix-turn-helix domain-containing protein n=1 Tax=Streptomyces sp. RFCAC02 TaxID=2499143 RepID=UPI00101F205C|nr:winged helix-turn-helix domain-containing protein [Streptomyces sp. RFCAC02]
MTADDSWKPQADPATDVVLDARGLRVLAHPLRLRLLRLLRQGPATATGLAQRTGLTSGATSYHMRQLAAVGLVAEDTERGNARDRWWRAVHRRTLFSDLDLAHSEPEATLAYLLSVAASHAETARNTLDALDAMPERWQEVTWFSDATLRLTPEETKRMLHEVHEVVSRYRNETAEGVPDAPEGAGRVSLIMQLLPDPRSVPETDGAR